MKKAFLFAVMLPALWALQAQAEFVPVPEKAPAPVTVAEAKLAGQNQVVVLEGYITGRAGTLNPEEFFFKDKTDMVKVEINHNVWRGQKVSPDTPIRITGEVDHNPFNKTVEIEVRYLEVIGK